MDMGFHASSMLPTHHIQSSQLYANPSSQRRYLNCMVCGQSVDENKEVKLRWYMERSTPAYVTNIRREAYLNGLNAGSLLFLALAVSQAAGCDGTRFATTTTGQEAVPCTLPIFQNRHFEKTFATCIVTPLCFIHNYYYSVKSTIW